MVVALAPRVEEPARRRVVSELVTALADAHGIEREDAVKIRQSVMRRAPDDVSRSEWRVEVSTLLLVHALVHAHDCLDPDCERCDDIGRRLEELDLWREREGVAEIERLLRVEQAARWFVVEYGATGVDSGRRRAAAARRLRAIIEGGDCKAMGQTKYSKTERRIAAKRSIGKPRRQVEQMAENLGVAPSTVYLWRTELLEAGLQDVPEDEMHLHDDVNVAAEARAVSEQEVLRLRARVRELESTLADLTTEIMRLRRLEPGASVGHENPGAQMAAGHTLS